MVNEWEVLIYLQFFDLFGRKPGDLSKFRYRKAFLSLCSNFFLGF